MRRQTWCTDIRAWRSRTILRVEKCCIRPGCSKALHSLRPAYSLTASSGGTKGCSPYTWSTLHTSRATRMHAKYLQTARGSCPPGCSTPPHSAPMPSPNLTRANPGASTPTTAHSIGWCNSTTRFILHLKWSNSTGTSTRIYVLYSHHTLTSNRCLQRLATYSLILTYPPSQINALTLPLSCRRRPDNLYRCGSCKCAQCYSVKPCTTRLVSECLRILPGM